MEAQDIEQPSTSAGSRRPRDFSSDEDEPFVKRSLYSSEVAGMWNLPRLVRELGTREQCVAFAEEQGLIPKEKKCRYHHIQMKVDYTTNKTVGSFVCHRTQCKGKSRIARSIGTWFENAKIGMATIFYLIYCYAHKWPIEKVIWEDGTREGDHCLSRTTIIDWYSYCREVVVLYQLAKQQYKGKIGGPGKIVQIDESKFGKRKYNKGRHIEGHWVLGLIEDGCEDLRLEVCPDNIRSAEVLVPLIKKHVEEGTTIHTDFWRAYDCLGDHGFIHKKVNHSDPDNPFIAPDGTHTQRIESQWRVVKRFFRDNLNTQDFGDLSVEYLWRRAVLKNKADPFMEIIKAIKYTYKV